MLTTWRGPCPNRGLSILWQTAINCLPGGAVQPVALPMRRASGGASDGARAHPLGLPCGAG
eukprot:70311-Chlamydomonas_euryale.AAC.1